jgi:hypothetical protein
VLHVEIPKRSVVTKEIEYVGNRPSRIIETSEAEAEGGRNALDAGPPINGKIVGRSTTYLGGRNMSENLTHRAASRPSATLPHAGTFRDQSRRTEVLRLFHAGLSRWEVELRLGIDPAAIAGIIDGDGKGRK